MTIACCTGCWIILRKRSRTSFVLPKKSGRRIAFDLSSQSHLMRIFAVQPSAEAVPFLMAEFRRYPEEVPDEMTEVLARIGAGALDGLLELWKTVWPWRK